MSPVDWDRPDWGGHVTISTGGDVGSEQHADDGSGDGDDE